MRPPHAHAHVHASSAGNLYLIALYTSPTRPSLPIESRAARVGIACCAASFWHGATVSSGRSASSITRQGTVFRGQINAAAAAGGVYMCTHGMRYCSAACRELGLSHATGFGCLWEHACAYKTRTHRTHACNAQCTQSYLALALCCLCSACMLEWFVRAISELISRFINGKHAIYWTDTSQLGR